MIFRSKNLRETKKSSIFAAAKGLLLTRNYDI